MTIKILAGDYDGDELIAHPIVNNTLLVHKKDMDKIKEELRNQLQQPSTMPFRLDADYPIFKLFEETK